MTGNSFGRFFRVTAAGESYSGAFRKDPDIDSRLYGGQVVIIDGVPAGLEVTAGIIQAELDKRKPGQSQIDTQRTEKDTVYILSGVMEEDRTTGAPVAVYIPNTDIGDEQIEKHRSYKYILRPGQASYTYFRKYGRYTDWYGAGRASGRETASRVAAGAIAKIMLDRLGIDVIAYVTQVYKIKAGYISYETAKANYRKNIINCPDLKAADSMISEILKAKSEGDTLGGVIEIIIRNAPAGLGEPVFDKLQATLSHALLSIGSIKGIEFGKGFELSCMKGSEANDIPVIGNGADGISFLSNNAGGILGGISNGDEIRIRAAVKPTPTIGKTQRTVDLNSMTETAVRFSTRNDPCICARIYPVCEAMVRIALADAVMIYKGYSGMQEAGESK
jgi:chorismate synthase